MTNTAVKEKLNSLEAQIRVLRTAVTKGLDFDIDEVNWKKIKPVFKKARAKVSKKVYG